MTNISKSFKDSSVKSGGKAPAKSPTAIADCHCFAENPIIPSEKQWAISNELWAMSKLNATGSFPKTALKVSELRVRRKEL